MAFATYLISGFKFGTNTVESKGTCTIEETATVNEHSADSSRTVNLVTVDRKGVNVTIELFNQNEADDLRVGDDGELVITAKLRTAGDGLSTVMTITIPKAVLTANSTTITSEGEGGVRISFQAYDDAADDTTDSALLTYT